MMEAGSQDAKIVSDIVEIASEVGIVQAQLEDLSKRLCSVSLQGSPPERPKEPVPPKPPSSPARNRLANLLLQVKEVKRIVSEITGALDL